MTRVDAAARPDSSGKQPSAKASGPGRVLVAVYAVFAAAATARGLFQILTKLHEAPLAYVLSLAAGLVYIAATVALGRSGRRWDRIAWAALAIELTGVLTVGVLSLAAPQDFPKETVWSGFGRGYGYIPLLLPLVGLWWLRKTTRGPRLQP